MSDNRPSDTLYNINSMPEECIRLTLIPLSLIELMNAGRVCTVWSTLQKSVCLTKKTLILLIGKDSKLTNFLGSSRDRLVGVLDDSGKPMAVDLWKRDFTSNGLKVANLNSDLIASFVKTFTNVTEIIIGSGDIQSGGVLPPYLSQVAALISQFRDKVVTLKLKFLGIRLTQDLFDAINDMPKLKHLALDIHNCQVDPFDLPILTQLDQFEFDSNMRSSILEVWEKHIMSRAEPLRIAFSGHGVQEFELPSISTKSAAMFSKFSCVFSPDVTQLKPFVTKFVNLVDLSIIIDTVQVPQLLQAIVKLKQLTSLVIITFNAPDFDRQNQHDRILPQLSTVKWLSLDQDVLSHADIADWNIGWTFPCLQVLYIEMYSKRCTECGYDEEDLKHIGQDGALDSAEIGALMVRVEECLCKQLRPVKKQCSRIRRSKITWHGPVNANGVKLLSKYTLEEIAD